MSPAIEVDSVVTVLTCINWPQLVAREWHGICANGLNRHCATEMWYLTYSDIPCTAQLKFPHWPCHFLPQCIGLRGNCNSIIIWALKRNAKIHLFYFLITTQAIHLLCPKIFPTLSLEYFTGSADREIACERISKSIQLFACCCLVVNILVYFGGEAMAFELHVFIPHSHINSRDDAFYWCCVLLHCSLLLSFPSFTTRCMYLCHSKKGNQWVMSYPDSLLLYKEPLLNPRPFCHEDDGITPKCKWIDCIEPVRNHIMDIRWIELWLHIDNVDS